MDGMSPTRPLLRRRTCDMNRRLATRVSLLVGVLSVSCTAWRCEAVAADADGKLRIICFGAHPDDAEYKAGGTAAKWAQAGHHVKFVSCHQR